jgi:hypothetical protein
VQSLPLVQLRLVTCSQAHVWQPFESSAKPSGHVASHATTLQASTHWPRSQAACTSVGHVGPGLGQVTPAQMSVAGSDGIANVGQSQQRAAAGTQSESIEHAGARPPIMPLPLPSFWIAPASYAPPQAIKRTSTAARITSPDQSTARAAL